MKTKVSFHILEDEGGKEEVIAIFPTEYYDVPLYGTTMVWSYMHMGQHGPCDIQLLTLQKASINQCQTLQQELEQIGYNLEII